MRYWFDTEFIEDGKTIDLLSIGIVCEDGREFYAQNRDADLDKASDWVRENVFPGLRDASDEQIQHRGEIASSLIKFVTGEPEIWAYYGDYDWVVLCQLFGTMMNLPQGWPMFAMDVKQLCISKGNPRLPKQDSAEHNALNDARWTKEAWEFLQLLESEGT
jgi:3'-5' exoribonuclease Rv2179c-like domain